MYIMYKMKYITSLHLIQIAIPYIKFQISIITQLLNTLDKIFYTIILKLKKMFNLNTNEHKRNNNSFNIFLKWGKLLPQSCCL